MSLLKTTNLTFDNTIKYPDMQIEKNKTTFFCGESGNGKTVLFKMFNGVLSPSHGKILFNKCDITRYDYIKLRCEILLVSQAAFLFEMSIAENFHEIYKYRDLETPTDEKIREFLKICNAEFPLDTSCIKLSGGEKHRVFMAICLSLKPKVLLLDEPTAALDDKNGYQIMDNIINSCIINNITPLIISHNKSFADKFADKIIVLEKSMKCVLLD